MKTLIALWEDAVEQRKNKLRLIIDNSDMLFFFRYQGNVYGTSENGRVIFAKMKDKKDDDNTKSWRKEASFTATNICELANGKQVQNVFGDKECNDIDVIQDKEDLFKYCK